VWHPGCKNTTRTEEQQREQVGIYLDMNDLLYLDLVCIVQVSLLWSASPNLLPIPLPIGLKPSMCADV
jgi:hypothetical protein